MTTNYDKTKNDVLESYEKLKELISELAEYSKGTDGMYGNPEEKENNKKLLALIQNKAEDIRFEPFCLMITGEAKSGKSTFINAYLGMELLPMDPRQCTSAIIEINYGKNFYINATYADGCEKKIEGDEACRDFLQKNAALNDEYRDIPVPSINIGFLIPYGLMAKEKGVKIEIHETDINDLLENDFIKKANTYYKSSESEYNGKIRKYINNNKDTWYNIVTKIEVFFPFEDKLRGIKIVDSPGVCAKGGVAKIAYEYIDNADAIIFLKPVSGQALESDNFNEFIDEVTKERDKNVLFLVLTYAITKNNNDLNIVIEEAYKQFNHKLNKDHIIAVDSLAELYAKKFSKTDNLKNEIEKLKNNGKYDEFIENAWNKSKSPFGNSKKIFISALEEKSRFSKLRNNLGFFLRKAHCSLFKDFLDNICELYKKISNDLSEHIDDLNKRAEDPKELSKKIEEKGKLLEKIKEITSTGLDNFFNSYIGGSNNIIKESTSKIIEDFKKRMNEIEIKDKNALEKLIHSPISLNKDLEKHIVELETKIVVECNEELKKKLGESSDKIDIVFESVKPYFTEETLSKIFETTKENATKKINLIIVKIPFYLKKEHIKRMKEDILLNVNIIEEDFRLGLSNSVEEIKESFKKELLKNIEAEKNELKAITNAKVNAEKNKANIEKSTKFKKKIGSAESDTKAIKGGIEKYEQE